MAGAEFSPIASRPPARVLRALELLLDAFDYARDLNVPTCEFAISLSSLRHYEVADIDVRWLLSRGYVAHLGERALFESMCLLPDLLQLVISEAGVGYAQQMLQRLSPPMPPAPVVRPLPRWDPERRELRLAEQLVKRFRVPAPNQECILSAFQEDAWSVRIDDPIPPCQCQDPKRRLHDTIIALNRGHLSNGLRFCGDGTGLGVCWNCDPARGPTNAARGLAEITPAEAHVCRTVPARAAAFP